MIAAVNPNPCKLPDNAEEVKWQLTVAVGRALNPGPLLVHREITVDVDVACCELPTAFARTVRDDVTGNPRSAGVALFQLVSFHAGLCRATYAVELLPEKQEA